MAVKQYSDVDHGFIITEIPSIDAFVYNQIIQFKHLDWWTDTLTPNYLVCKCSVVFSKLFKFLLSPKILPVHVMECDWLIQRCCHWERPTASIKVSTICFAQVGNH